MDTILDIVRQEEIESKFSKKLIDPKIREAILGNSDMLSKIQQGAEMVKAYCNQDTYASKMARLAQVQQLDHEQLVLDIFMGVAYFPVETLFTTVCAMVSGRLGFDDRREAITTVSELLAILAETDAFDLTKANRQASIMLQSRIPLSEELVEFVHNSQYLPPMVCKPLELESNYSSGYLSYKESLILRAGNHHDGDICLDVLNTMNQVPLKLDIEFLMAMDEVPKHALETAEQRDMWNAFKHQSSKIYLLLVKMGNRFYLTHKVDKRGRAYAQGYHVTTQGAPFKKAMIELANEEVVEGVPT